MRAPIVVGFGLLLSTVSLESCRTSPAGSKADPGTGLRTQIVHEASGVAFALVPAGEFWMGSPPAEPDRDSGETRHRRRIREPFYLGETEITVAQFRRFVEASGYKTDAERGTPEGEHGRGAFASTPEGDRAWVVEANWRNPFPSLGDFQVRDSHPVVQVSWNDAKAFADFYGFTLPSEAQWEYAARAGGEGRFPWGDGLAEGEGYANVLDRAAEKRFPAWKGGFPFDDGAPLLALAGSCRPNPWGFRDLIGNVAEWVEDADGPYPREGATEAPVQGKANAPRGVRGGSWLDLPFLCRTAARAALGPTWRRDFVGFRVVMRAER